VIGGVKTVSTAKTGTTVGRRHHVHAQTLKWIRLGSREVLGVNGGHPEKEMDEIEFGYISSKKTHTVSIIWLRDCKEFRK